MSGNGDKAGEDRALEEELERQKPEIAEQAKLLDATGNEIDRRRVAYLERTEAPRWDGFAAAITGFDMRLLTQLIQFRALTFVAEERGETLETGEDMVALTKKLVEEGDAERQRMLVTVYAEGILFGWVLRELWTAGVAVDAKAEAASYRVEQRVEELENVKGNLHLWGVNRDVEDMVAENIDRRIAQLQDE